MNRSWKDGERVWMKIILIDQKYSEHDFLMDKNNNRKKRLINRKMQTKTKKHYFLPIGTGKMPKFWQDHMLEEMKEIVYWDRPV